MGVDDKNSERDKDGLGSCSESSQMGDQRSSLMGRGREREADKSGNT